MKISTNLLAAFLMIALIWVSTTKAQSPAPIVVQAATAAPATSTSLKTPTSATDLESLAGAIKQLEQIKAANEEVLTKQKAALEKLEELKASADQLQIFAKRG